MELVSGLNKEGMTIVFVTHDPRMAEFAERVIELQDGKVLGIGDQQLISTPQPSIPSPQSMP
jgi:ABC-type lipoprotein export system ATPase subunit